MKMNSLILYIDNIEKMKFLKKKIPKIRWFGGEDVVEWHPNFPFIIFFEDNCIIYSTIRQVNSEVIKNAKFSSKNFFKLKNNLELE